MRRQGSLSVALASCLLMVGARAATAQSAADKATAEQLFDEARALMAARQFAEACPKLEVSLRLDAALGTRLNLAACYEEIGQLASAWGMYREAEDLAAKQGQGKRVKFAQERAAALLPRLPRLVVEVPEAVRVEGLRITRDGTLLDATLYGASIYVDPGERLLTIAAPGYQTAKVQVQAFEGQEVRAVAPSLIAEPVPVAPEVAEVEPSAVSATVLIDRGRSRRLAGLAAMGAGVVGLGVGAGFGLWAKRTWDDAKADGRCDLVTNQCTAAGQSLADDARRRATVSTIAVGLGAAVLATGVVLYFTAPRPERRAVVVMPSAAPGAGGLSVSGYF